jgi:predicted ferric reductase
MEKSTKWTDIGLSIASVAIIGLSIVWMIKSGMFNFTLDQDQKLSWHLVRSSGIVAYLLLLASTVWGLFISSQFVKDWSPGPISLTMHSTISWLALLLGLIHALLLMFDNYFTYTLSNIFVPFTGPYRPEAVGLGTLAFWIIVVVALSFPLKKRIGHVTWKRLHYMSYAAFGLVSLHGLFAGTDGTNLGFRVLVGIGILLVVLLLGIRMGKDQEAAQAVASRAKAKGTPHNEA